MENLNAEQIVIEIQGHIKALKANNGWWENRGRGGWFNHDILVDALALITSQEQRIGAQDMTISELRQRAEKAEHDARRYEQKITAQDQIIEAYRQELGEVRVALAEANKERQELTEENERLKALNRMYESNALCEKVCEKSIVVSTVRQMQERIKERCIKGCIYPAFRARTVDQIAEEIIGDAKQ